MHTEGTCRASTSLEGVLLLLLLHHAALELGGHLLRVLLVREGGRCRRREAEVDAEEALKSAASTQRIT